MHYSCWLAYLDPGVGSIVFQAMAAGLIGAVVFLKSIRMRIASLFFGRRNSASTTTDKSDESNP